MPGDKDNPYDMLLEEIKKRDDRIDSLEKTVKEVCDFNRTLLERINSKESGGSKDDKGELNKKFEDYLEGK